MTFCTWFLSLRKCFQGSATVAVSVSTSFLSTAHNLYCMYISHFIHSYCWTFEFFLPFGYCECCCCEHSYTGICLSCSFHYFWVSTRSGIVGLCGNPISFLRTHHIVFHSGLTILHSHWQNASFPISLYYY